MVINIVTVVEAVVLFRCSLTSASIIFEHVKVACSMFVCNLLVIVTFVYRSLREGDTDTEDAVHGTSKIELTTVDLAYWGELSQLE